MTRWRVPYRIIPLLCILVLLLALFGALKLGASVVHRIRNKRVEAGSRVRIPNSKLPGLSRDRGSVKFELTAENSRRMFGMYEAENERWADVAGNNYSQRFISSFSYSHPPPKGPVVRVRMEPTVFLPPGLYRAEIVLTEESFHSRDNDGGWWTTVFVCPVEFAVTGPRSVDEKHSDYQNSLTAMPPDYQSA